MRSRRASDLSSDKSLSAALRAAFSSTAETLPRYSPLARSRMTSHSRVRLPMEGIWRTSAESQATNLHPTAVRREMEPRRHLPSQVGKHSEFGGSAPRQTPRLYPKTRDVLLSALRQQPRSLRRTKCHPQQRAMQIAHRNGFPIARFIKLNLPKPDAVAKLFQKLKKNFESWE